jgi:Tfp pilus assembly protein PilP
MTGPQPWLWPRTFQYGLFALAVLAGALFLSPWAWQSWSQWKAVLEAQEALLAQQQHADALQSQTTQLLSEYRPVQPLWADVTAWTESAQQQGLEVSSLVLESPHAHEALSGLQLLPVRVKVHGTWQAWLNWWSQTSTHSPGVTLSSLELKADSRGGVSAQLSALLPQSSAHASNFSSASAAGSAVSPDPFSPQHWTQAQQLHAAQHPSYEQWVRPELARSREPLEEFSRERLQYVGHLTSRGAREALIRVQPAGDVNKAMGMWQVHRVRVGHHMGTRFGKVLTIAEDHVLLQELSLTPNGVWQPNTVRLRLQEDVP